MNDHNHPRTTPSPPLPLDLRHLIDEALLLRLSFSAVQSLDWSAPELAGQINDRFRPQMMMTLLAYSYAAGLFGSGDVQWAIANDRNVRYICAHSFPEARDIRNFRRRNRASLQEVLSHLLRQIWACRLDQAEEVYPGYDWIETILIHRSESSSANRLEAAAIIDQIHFDE